MSVLVGYNVILCLMKVSFNCSFIGFHKKVSLTKINIGPKDAECNIDVSFGWVSYDIPSYKGGFQVFFAWV